MDELWKDINGYEGIYQISDKGQVKSLQRYDSIGRLVKERILKQSIGNSGYKQVVLSKNGVTKIRMIHRLVAETFIPNPDNKPQIDHIDNNKLNNNLSNLKWVTEKENMANEITRKTLQNRPKRCVSDDTKEKIRNKMIGRIFSDETKDKISNSKKGKKHSEETKEKIRIKNGIKTLCINDGNIFNSQKEASDFYSIPHYTINRICCGKLDSWNGYRFCRFVD